MPDTLKHTGIELHRAHPERPREFAIFGERGTGTGATEKLIKENLPLDLTTELGWKHGFPGMIGVSRRVLVVVVFRNGVNWIKSLFNRPYHSSKSMQKLCFSNFIRAPWESEIDYPNWLGLRDVRHVQGNALQADRHPLTGKRFQNPLALRDAKHAALLGFRNREVNYVFLRHENLFADPDASLNQISETFELPREPNLIYSEKNVHSGKHEQKRRALIPNPLPETDLAFLAQELETETEAEIGYTYPDLAEKHPG